MRISSLQHISSLIAKLFGMDARGKRLNESSFFEMNPPNGKVISNLLLTLCKKEKPLRLLAIRTPTTGAWLEGLPYTKITNVSFLRYLTAQQSNFNSLYITRDNFYIEMQKIKNRGETFDLIALDSFHDYQCSYEDFELCLQSLGKHGVMLSHDCAPASVELAESNYREGSWCGQTYASLIKFGRFHPELAITVLDTDTGVGIIRRRESKLRSRWLPSVELDEDLQDRFLALVESNKPKEAYYFFKTFGSYLIDLRSSGAEDIRIQELNR